VGLPRSTDNSPPKTALNLAGTQSWPARFVFSGNAIGGTVQIYDGIVTAGNLVCTVPSGTVLAINFPILTGTMSTVAAGTGSVSYS
jgi:hypothetical protein